MKTNFNSIRVMYRFDYNLNYIRNYLRMSFLEEEKTII